MTTTTPTGTITVPAPAPDRKASWDTRENVHAKWHQLFGDDCRIPDCPKRKEAR